MELISLQKSSQARKIVLMVDHPESRRKHTRVEANLLARYPDENGAFMDVCVANISKGGMFIETLNPRPYKDVFEVFLKIPDAKEEIAIQAEVVHVMERQEILEEYKGRLGMGMRFIIIEPKQKDILNKFIVEAIQAAGLGDRNDPRIYTYKPIKIQIKSVDEFKKSYMANISRGGLYFETNEELTPFDMLDIILISPKGDKEIHLASTVVHIRKSHHEKDETIQGVGVKFSRTSVQLQKAVEHFIQTILETE